jgi:signal transduction histidine kinase/ActR/RegA family two-component response regulator
MLRCQLCGGPGDELARTGQHIWLGCRDCHRSWRAAWAGSGSELPVVPPMPKAERTAWTDGSIVKGSLLTIVAVSIAFTVRLALKPIIGEASPFLLFTPVVMLAAFYGGPAAGLLATGLSAVLGSHFFLQTLGETVVEKWDRVTLFLLVGTLITALNAVVRSTRQRLSESLWRELKARAQAEAANESKDRFLATISHELQTPASVVLGWAATIRTSELTGEALGRALAAIERNARVQSKLVEDMLDIARITSGTLRFDRQFVDLTSVVRAAVEQIRPSLEKRHLDLAFELDGEECPMLADPLRLHQVFTNLLSNAVKFTPIGGRVGIAMARTSTQTTIAISDTGVGIAPEFLHRMFHPFEQDSHTVSFSHRGLGLGLSICRHLVEQHGGAITAASEGPGKGTTVTVTLPLEQRTGVTEDAHCRVALDALRSVSVLVVEHDDDTRAFMTAVLERYGANVRGSASAAEALRILKRTDCDVLLCDLRMPGVDGLDFIRDVRSQADDHVISFPAASIAVSARPQDHDEALSAGYQLHLRKPVEPEDLAAAVLALRRPRDGPVVH